MSGTIETLSSETRNYTAPKSFKSTANATPDLYDTAQTDRLKFWDIQAKNLHWSKPWKTTLEWNRPNAKWFKEGELNAAYNCLDIHLEKNANKTAIIWQGENDEIKTYTYQELHEEVCKLSNALEQDLNIKKGDRVTLYMPMIPELAISVLACARIGAIHSVVFGGFSAKSLRDRIENSESKLLLTSQKGSRRGSPLNLQTITKEAISQGCKSLDHVIYDINDLTQNQSPNHIATPMNAEAPLFILYTSGTTGKPKGIIHSTGGYMTHAKYSTKMVFDLKPNDIYWCTADIGWITGHTYLIYGPLANGATCFMYEGTPDYPDTDRFWQLIAQHKITIFYTAPTAIRAFMKTGLDPIKKHDITSLRLLGTVGEPINPEAWTWYHEHIGSGNCPIVDTWWQTETGGIMISNLPALNDMKPGKAGLPLPGINAKVLNPDSTEVTHGGGLLSLTEPWPSMLRGVWGDEERFKETYWSKFDTYFAGDGATVDKDGYFMVLGRVDDVLNCAGHRIGTMEVESAIVEHSGVAEAAVVGMPDDIKGQAIAAFVILENTCQPTPELEKEIIKHVANSIGPIAKPKKVLFTPELPKTRSGKIMRRLLRNIAEDKPLGDCTTLANPKICKKLELEFNKTERKIN